MPDQENREFRPELLSRRGEWTAWALTLAASTGMVVLHLTAYIPLWAWIFWAFLLFSGTSISLGNWMDRHTVITLDPEGVHFENGLRKIRLHWSQIKQVAMLPARIGKTVQVIGGQAHFEFKAGGEVHFQGEVRGLTGFADGQDILDSIVKEAGLKLIERSKEAYYYERV
jgi:hypothetical protein